MQPSLSALLPVRNAQSTIQAAVSELLEVLPDLTDRFQLVVVDDCSTDATAEILPELAACYPQVLLAHHASPLGRAAALRTGLVHSSGSIVFFQDENCTLAIDEVHKLWRAASRHEIVIGRAPGPGKSKRDRRKPALSYAAGNYQFVHRPVLAAFQASLADETTLLEILAELGRPWLEVEVRDRSRPGGEAGKSSPRRRSKSARADLSRQAPGRPQQPNYLKRLRDFALGE